MTILHRLRASTITFSVAVGIALLTSPAFAEWQFSGGEGSSYAFTTDGGFVDGSYKNGLMFFCPDDGNSCELYVTINGQIPQPPVAVTFAFSDGQTVQRLAEPVGGQERSVIGWQDGLLEKLLSESSVTVSIENGPSHTFSLSGSTTSIRQAMNL